MAHLCLCLGINNLTITTNGPAAIKAASNVSSKAALNSTNQPMPTMGTGDLPQQDVEVINADGVRSYLFPSGGGNPVCVSQESYPSFTSSSSGGSNKANSGNDHRISQHCYTRLNFEKHSLKKRGISFRRFLEI